VAAVTHRGVRLELAAPVKSGDGLVFDGDEARALPEQGGRVYEVIHPGPGNHVPNGLAAGATELRFSRRDVDVSRIRPGQRVWKTDDPELTRRLRRTFQGPSRRTVDLDVAITAHTGAPLRLEGQTATDLAVAVAAAAPLTPAEQRPATEEWLHAQLDRLGG